MTTASWPRLGGRALDRGVCAAGLPHDQTQFGITACRRRHDRTPGPAHASRSRRMGEVKRARAWCVAQARAPATIVWVTGTIGDAGLGAQRGARWLPPAPASPSADVASVQRYRLPEPRVAVWAGAWRGVAAAADRCLRWPCGGCRASRAVFAACTSRSTAMRLPLSRQVLGGRERVGHRSGTCLSAWDDYEIAFTAPPWPRGGRI
jgi:thiamine monophosphate kinase